jgi:hypothetical protein
MNAVCNIAATAAPNGLVGCFCERNLVLVQTFRVHLESFRGHLSVPSLYDLVLGNFLNHNFDDGPLNESLGIAREVPVPSSTLLQ